MTLQSGTRLGPYEVIASIGAGGMGEVYRAKDTKLGRDVAIKVLPAAFADDPERLARFTREAQTLASLNHPNIATIHGIEEVAVQNGATAGSRALVMELVEGEDLSAHIARGPLLIAQALPIARQIVEALEAAHEQGIVHRDLKPANIKVREDGTVKVLDFGLAKAADGSSAANSGLSHSPTMSRHMTEAGMIMGTAAYMSPEQARGRAVDKRTDVWAFGCVLYEMLSGRRAFDGEDATEIISAVVKSEPEWSALPENVPAHLRSIVTRCLVKDRKARIPDLSVVRFMLDGSLTAPSAPAAAPAEKTPAWRRALPWSLAVAAGLSALAFALRPPAVPEAARPVGRFAILPPEGQAFASAPRMAISPDGRYLVVAIPGGASRPEQLWLRRLDSTELTPVPGTEGTPDATQPQSPFWSQDAQRFGYFVESSTAGGRVSRLRIAGLSGGAVQTLCDFPSNNAGATWNAEGVILVSTQATQGVQRISASGCAPKPVTTLDASRDEVAHLFPEFLPDGRHFIYQSQTKARGNWGIFVGSIDSEVRRQVVQAEYARFAAPNVLLYVEGEQLLAHSMNLKTHELAGEPVLIADGVPSVGTNGRRGFTVSNAGVLVTSGRSGMQGAKGNRQLTWLDRSGKPVGTVGVEISSSILRLSPDGTQVALMEQAGRSAAGGVFSFSLWVAELDRAVKAPLTSERPAWGPVWTADSRRLRFASRDPSGESSILERLSNGATTASTVYEEKGVRAIPLDEAPDGTLLFSSPLQQGKSNLRILPRAGGKATTYLADGFDHPHAAFSPDGRWVALASNESGAYEVIVQPFPDPSLGKWRISTTGGLAPRWRRDGRELFYLDSEQRLIAVSVNAGREFTPGQATPLFQLPVTQWAVPGTAYGYDVSPDGRRFLVAAQVEARETIPLTVTTNWTSLLTKK
jgi:Tol biopolymer transport system component